MMSQDFKIEQMGKLMKAFALAAKKNHVPSIVQAETALLICYRIFDVLKISKEEQDKFIEDVHTLFEKMKGNT
jgi:hypothetical protein